MTTTTPFSGMSAKSFTVFKALLWAEYGPRRSMLRNLLLLQVLLCVRHFFWNYDISTGIYSVRDLPFFDGLAKYMALGTIAYSLFFWRGEGFAVRAPWQRMGLPVSLQLQLLAGLGFQVLVALLAGGIWGLDRYVGQEPSPFLLPILIATALAVQGYALTLWWAASNLMIGTVFSVVGLAASLMAGLLLVGVSEFPVEIILPAAMIAVGALWCQVAALASQRGLVARPKAALGLPSEPASSKRVTMNPYAATRTSTGALVPIWAIMSATCWPTFGSPFWAQCWFEWRRTAMWLPITVAVGFVLFALTGGTDSPVLNVVAMLFMMLVPTVISFKHLQVTPQYRSFVLARPIASRDAGRAKTVSMAFAILITGCVTEIPRLFFELIGGDIPSLSDLVGDAILLVTYAVLGLYGVFAVAVGLLGSLISLPFDLLRIALLEFKYPTGEMMTRMREPIPGVDVLATLCATWLLFRSIGRRHGVTVCWPRELWIPVFALLPSVLIALVDSSSRAGTNATLWYIWVTPFITLGAILGYGLRTGLISRRDNTAGWVLFGLFYVVAGLCFRFPTDATTFFITMQFGHWCVLLASALVWYPFAIESQRQAGDKDKSQPYEPGSAHRQGDSQ